MKRLFYILVLAMSVLVLPGCNKFDDEVFDKSSSERVQELIDEVYTTLTSSEEGWYFNFYQGWNQESELGGYWFVCKFNKDYTVEAASEIDIPGYPAGSVAKSDFGIIRGRGAVLSFNVYNDVMHFLANPSWNLPNAYEGDYEFTISEVAENEVTVIGIRSGKTMKLYRKTDGKTVQQAVSDLKATGIALGSKSFETVVVGAYVNDEFGYAPSTTAKGLLVTSDGSVILGRQLTITYDVFVDMVDREVEVEPGVFETVSVPETTTYDAHVIYTPNFEGTRLDLYEPVTIMDREITAFAYDPVTGTYTSNDAEKTVVLTGIAVPDVTIEDVVGDYVVNAISSFDGPVVFDNVTITKTGENTVSIAGIDNTPFKFEAVFNADAKVLIAKSGQKTGYNILGTDITFQNSSSDYTVFDIWGPGSISVSNQRWGFIVGSLGWYSLLTDATFVRQ